MARIAPCRSASGNGGRSRNFASETWKAILVAALAAKAAPVPIPAITTPAIAGPMKRARLNTTELIASADGSEARSTRFGISAIRAGCDTELVMPSSSTSANNSSIVIVSVIDEQRQEARLGAGGQLRQAQDPRPGRAGRPAPRRTGSKTSAGRKSASATRPSQVPEWVRVQVSQPTATRCSHQPISEMPLPVT